MLRQRRDNLHASACRQPQIDNHDIDLYGRYRGDCCECFFGFASYLDAVDRAEQQDHPASDEERVFDEKDLQRWVGSVAIHVLQYGRQHLRIKSSTYELDVGGAEGV